MYLVLAASLHRTPDPGAQHRGPLPEAYLQRLNASGAPAGAVEPIPAGSLASVVGRYETQHPRWVWDHTANWYPRLLAEHIEVERCHDLTLSGSILALSEFTRGSAYARRARPVPVADDERSLPRQIRPVPAAADQFALFDDDTRIVPAGAALEDLVEDLAAQLAAVAGAGANQRAKLALLLAAESAGALVAAEMQHAGVPWRADIHDRLLTRALGPRPVSGHRPAELERLAAEVAERLSAQPFNLDSPQELMRALHRAGIEARSTRSWELEQWPHSAIAPLLQYKKLSRLLAANGWTWLDAWVDGGRFRPEYVVGGVVSGRWASRGGGALQIPKLVRDSVRPDPGHKLIVADAAQLEPRILAALAKDTGMALAATGRDLYAGIAAQGFGGDRAKAKVAMLGAMYGATTGESGRLMPQLARTYPQAVSFVEAAARAGEAGRVVSSFLGRSCPPPSDAWRRGQQSTTAEQERAAAGHARSRGRFTRNFVVQATAAEWAQCWLAELRRRLHGSGPAGAATHHGRAGELVFFLHDEVMVHAPESRIAEASATITAAAAAATNLLFGAIPIDFPVEVAVVDSYADVK